MYTENEVSVKVNAIRGFIIALTTVLVGFSPIASGEAIALGGSGIADRHCGSNWYWSAYTPSNKESVAHTYVKLAGCGGKLSAGLSGNGKEVWHTGKNTGDAAFAFRSGKALDGMHLGCGQCVITWSLVY